MMELSENMVRDASRGDVTERGGMAPARARPVIADDRDMLRLAAALARDLARHDARIYWADMLGSAFVGYAALFGAIMVDGVGARVLLGLAAILALYRAVSFIHELSHMKEDSVPGFRLAWNTLVGVPLMVPSFMYEEVHTQHHARTRYGTAEDPEYLPLALMKPWTLPLFVVMALLLPVGLILRFGVLAPLSALFPPVRRFVRERVSALAINPAYRRRAPADTLRRRWIALETGACLWAWVLIGSVFVFGWVPLACFLAVHSGISVLNQLRTLVAHLWENEGEALSVTAQYLDSVNVPPPSALAPLWAPVGLRYHALHHLLPSVPYHNLGRAHARMARELEAASVYNRASYPGMMPLVGKIARSTMRPVR